MKPTRAKTETESLTHELKKLNKNFSLQASLLRGIVSGFGTAVGAGVVVTLVAVIFEYLTDLPILGQLFAFLAGNLPTLR